LVFAALGAIVKDDADAACYVGCALIRAGHGSCENGASIHRPKPARQPRPFGAARTYAAAPGAFGAPGPPAAAPPPPQGGSFGGLFAGGGSVPPKMPRGSATTAPPRDYGSGFSSTYSAFGGGGLGLFASAPGFITTTPRVVDDSSAPGARDDTTRRPSP